MKIFTKTNWKLIVALFVGTFSGVAQNETVVAVKPQADAPTISKHIYGHFSEHLGRCIYDGLYVGENSSIPNTGGVRNDVIKALKDLKIPNLRWPGGCFADTYHWKDGIGPKKDRPTIVNNWWGGVTEDNSFGTNEFLNLCEVLGTEPYLAGNVGSGTPQELADWVQYVNHEGKSPMSDLRKKNNREKPWKVTYWGVGNEMWGCGGHMTPEFYANLYRQYATFMSDWSNSSRLFRIASGANVDDYHWTEVLMRDIPKHLIEGVALHSYSFVDWGKKGSATKYDESQYFATIKRALYMDELVVKHSAIMDKYDPENKVALVVDEWGGWYDVEEGTNPGFLYQQNTMRDAMIAGTTLNIFNNHSKRVKMANLAQTVNVLQAVILTEGNKMLLTPTYHVMQMYTVHHDAKLIPVTVSSNQKYTHKGESLPAISVSASEDKEGNIHISLVNIDFQKNHKVSIEMDEVKNKKISGTILTSEKITDYNTFDKATKIAPKKFDGVSVRNKTMQLTIPPFSVVVIKCAKK